MENTHIMDIVMHAGKVSQKITTPIPMYAETEMGQDSYYEWVTFGKAINLEYISAIAWKAECERNGDKARIVEMGG